MSGDSLRAKSRESTNYEVYEPKTAIVLLPGTLCVLIQGFDRKIYSTAVDASPDIVDKVLSNLFC